MKDWVKTTLWVIIGFCMVSALAGIFQLFAFLQVSGQRVQGLWISDETMSFFTVNTAVTVACAVAAVALIVFVIVELAKGSRNKKLIIAILAVVLVIAIFFAVYPFMTMEMLKNEKYESFRDDGAMYTEDYSHCESFLSAALSTFLPILISAGTALGYFLFNAKKPNATATETENAEQNI